MQRTMVIDLLNAEQEQPEVLVKGWIRTRRDSKEFSFIEINDGSCLKNIQIVAQNELPNYDEITSAIAGTSLSVVGQLVKSLGSGQKWEIRATNIVVFNIPPESYPLQKKRHSDEFLRTIAHLRPRTNKYGALFRIRSELSYAIHHFFRNNGFRYIHTPIITGSDCEGAGELFRVSAIDVVPTGEKGNPDFSEDFFGKEAKLTVSGQLSAEMFALSLGNVYTFGPTFRAENSNTSRHAAEFWMVEPEMAFCDNSENMSLAETFIKYLVAFVKENCIDDLDLFAIYVDNTLLETLDTILNSEFIRLPYEDAIALLLKSGKNFEYEISFGNDLQSEHERFLVEEHFKQPVIVFDYPKTIKPFYMRLNDDNKTVAAMDVLVPRIGEIIGGSQREERFDILEKRMDEFGLDKNHYWWYLESRKYGSAIHSGFGLGFERLLMLITGIKNIRDVIPFPRTPNNLEF